ncbi:flavodoxin domain-containing protein [uncultured Clostridium sp.]|uniref:flavodoxin domain-containing protein n=1 Tax=uncultured Clostridium sp. TaxID=59620 RepID=UPI00260EDEBC|nr:flavodoxin domain-containing protein [uncultured Clostridium sp.]
MKRGIILYKSKYGATKRYASWLVEETKFDCIEIKYANVKDLQQYDRIILCGGIYASGIAGLSFFRKNISKLSNKKLAILCVGASPYEEKAFEQIKSYNLKDDLKEIPIFYGRGAWDEEKMSIKDRSLCKLLKMVISKKDSGTYDPWMKELLISSGKKCDWTNKEYLKPLLEFIK